MPRREHAPPASAPAGAHGDRRMEETELMRRLAAGDRDGAAGALYDRFGPRLYGVGLRLLGDRGLAEELVQETFVRLWRSAGRFDPARGSASTFVFTIARRAAVDLHRRPSSRPLAELDERDLARREALESGDEFEHVVLGLELREALDELSEEQRSVLELHYREDLTQQQIAERLGLPLGTVKSRTLYGLRALKAELARRDADG